MQNLKGDLLGQEMAYGAIICSNRKYAKYLFLLLRIHTTTGKLILCEQSHRASRYRLRLVWGPLYIVKM